MLTLASSAFGIPGARFGANALSYGGDRSTIGAGDSISHISGLLGDDERMFNDGEMDRDVDASVRALRPRSSRRGSWESGASGWSAAVTGSGYQRNRSLWTSNSTGDTPAVDEYGDDDNENDTTSVEDSSIPGTADLSIADTISEMTDDGKVRGRSNTVTASEKTTSPLLTPTEPLPSVRLPDPEGTPKLDKEFANGQEQSRTSVEQRSSVDEPGVSPERTPAPVVIPLPEDTRLAAISA